MCDDKEFRPLTHSEVQIIRRLLSPNPRALDLFEKNVGSFKCLILDEFGSLKISSDLKIASDADSGPMYSGRQSAAEDDEFNGAAIEFILFFNRGILDELQIYTDDGAPMVFQISPDRIDII